MSDLLTGDIGQRFKVPCEQIDGRTPIKGRQKIVDLFSDYSEPAILILNPRAAGAGINITAAKSAHTKKTSIVKINNSLL